MPEYSDSSGKNGAEQILEINFNEAEKRKLWHSAEELKNISPDLKNSLRSD